MQTKTDCRTDEGITVGIIDSIITLSRLLRGRDLDCEAVREALKDVADDEDFAWLLRQIKR